MILDVYHEPQSQNDLNPSSSQENIAQAQTPALPQGEKKTKPTSYQDTLRKNRLLLAMNKVDDASSISSTDSAVDTICHLPPLIEGEVCIFILPIEFYIILSRFDSKMSNKWFDKLIRPDKVYKNCDFRSVMFNNDTKFLTRCIYYYIFHVI